MKILNNKEQLVNSFVHLHGQDWIDKQRMAGKCLADIMTKLTSLVQSGEERNLLALDKIAEKEIKSRGCTCTFFQFKGFPGNVCMSVNKELVHGIPKDYTLQDGDMITFDFGATFEGAIADSAKTFCVGSKEDPEIVRVANQCLYNAIKSIKIGEKIGSIGHAIYRTAKKAGYNVIDRYGGHGIDWDRAHADIFVSNRSEIDEGIRVQPGLTIAIEPLIGPGNCSTRTEIADDGWTVITPEGIFAHTEHSIYVHQDKVEIMTWREEEAPFIAREIVI